MEKTNYQFSNPYIRKLGYLTWFVLMLFSIIFYKERAIFLDGAFQLCKMINEGQFKIYHYRLTNPLTQILALSAIYLKLPLKVVLLAYSLNFILLFAFIYHAIVAWFKNDYLGWVLIFFFTLITLDSFYFLPPELYQGAALMLLWFAILLHDPQLKKWWVFPVLALLLIPIVSDSRLTPVYFCFTAAFIWLDNPRRWNLKAYLLFALFFVFVFIHGQYFVADYDQMKMTEFHANLDQYYFKPWEIPAHQIFLTKCRKIYYFYPIFLVLVVTGYLWAFFKKDETVNFPLLKLLLVLGANFMFILVLHIGSPNTTYRFYAEVNYLPLTIMVSLPLVFDFASKIKKEKLLLGLLVFIVAIRLNTIANNGQKFKKRHNYYIQQMNRASELGSKKSAISTWDTPQNKIIQPWATAQETLLLSSLDGPQASRALVVFEDPKLYQHYKNDEYVFLTFFQGIHIDKMNSNYFQLGKGTCLLLPKQIDGE